jgi:hypothetical protein
MKFTKNSKQTGQPRGSFKYKEAHPTIEGMYFRAYQFDSECWNTMDGLLSIAAKARARVEAGDKEKRAAYLRQYNKDNKERVEGSKLQWRVKNRNKVNAAKRKNYATHPRQKVANSIRRAAVRGNISLNTSRKREVSDIYEMCQSMTICSRGAGSSEIYHVDHIYPLRGVGFSGLHAPWNLRVITATENLMKYNKTPILEI